MSQASRQLTPFVSGRHFFGSELRCWRQRRGFSLAQLAREVHVSPDLLAKIEKADRAANSHIADRCDDALETGGTLGRLWSFVEQQTAADRGSNALVPVVITALADAVVRGGVHGYLRWNR